MDEDDFDDDDDEFSIDSDDPEVAGIADMMNPASWVATAAEGAFSATANKAQGEGRTLSQIMALAIGPSAENRNKSRPQPELSEDQANAINEAIRAKQEAKKARARHFQKRQKKWGKYVWGIGGATILGVLAYAGSRKKL